MNKREVLSAYAELPEELRTGLYNSYAIDLCRSQGNERFALEILTKYVCDKMKTDIII